MELDDAYQTIDASSLESFRITFNEMLKSKEPARFILKTRKKDGALFWAESHVNPIFDQESGDLIEGIVITRDISERIALEDALKENARQKELLMQEIHHRTRNNFAILISLIGLQKFETQNLEVLDILSDLQSRIRTMVLIHEQLYRSNSVNIVTFGKYITSLTESISSTFKKEGITLHQEISECQLNIEKALPLGLVVNELLTNSYKYAFAERRTGKILVKLSPVLNNAEDKVENWELIIEDDGIGLPETFSTVKNSSMGWELIQMLVEQINGRIYFSGIEGASFRIIFSETTII